MSTLGSVMNTALRSMAMNQLALSVASNNIANAQTPEFSRQKLITTPAGPEDGNFLTGTGVEVVRIQAMRDNLIETRLRQETSAKAGDEALTRALDGVESLFNDSEDTGLLRSLTTFFNSFHTLSLDPASMSFREELKISAQTLIDTFHAKSRDLATIRRLVDASVASDLARVNTLTKQIAAVTVDIRQQETQQVSNDLRDRRAALIRELSGFVEVLELESGGEYQVSTKDNTLLVFGTTTFDIETGDIATSGNGSLAAEARLRDELIPGYSTALDQLAYEIGEKVNAIHADAYDMNGSTGIRFFAQLSSAAGAAAGLELSSEVAADARQIAASELSTGNDNRAAMQLGNLLHESVFSGGAVTDQYRTLVFNIGSDLATARKNRQEHEALEHQLENRKQSISGVSIEEETVQILQFQRAYEASARLIRTVDELLKVVLGMGAP